jgi:hypothetical protein
VFGIDEGKPFARSRKNVSIQIGRGGDNPEVAFIDLIEIVCFFREGLGIITLAFFAGPRREGRFLSFVAFIVFAPATKWTV